ncbi:hypothetical protein C482_16868 [Natrialba chahannaoensis JCM 10990]|uniref:Uncharacterized protein n=1 Tax=Natrialba chahannaoensis JCM 10990 TaxID=1227492 RepID=M0ADA1_9EURY|nr:hypothetical protein [Natrialba chahannaoensis]ELY95333.1 hypothetical protein C482_16868 [Natrialba chahannaoensis JCM 10990]
MIGLLTVGKKAMTVGYRRYGVRGALAMGLLTVVGYVLLRRALDRAADSERVTTASPSKPFSRPSTNRASARSPTLARSGRRSI